MKDDQAHTDRENSRGNQLSNRVKLIQEYENIYCLPSILYQAKIHMRIFRIV